MSGIRRTALLTVLVVLVTGVTLGGVGTVAAQSDTDDGLLDGTLINASDDRDCSPMQDGELSFDSLDREVCKAASDGAIDRAQWWASSKFTSFQTDAVALFAGEDDSEPAVEEHADDVQLFWNQNADHFEAEYNDDVDLVANDTYVVGIGFELYGEETERYLVATTNENGTAETEMTASISEDATISETVRLCDHAADQAPEELKSYNETYVGTDEDPDMEYGARMAGRYGIDVSSSLYETRGDCNAGEFW